MSRRSLPIGCVCFSLALVPAGCADRAVQPPGGDALVDAADPADAGNLFDLGVSDVAVEADLGLPEDATPFGDASSMDGGSPADSGSFDAGTRGDVGVDAQVAAASCQGVPTACATLDTTACGLQTGCRTGGAFVSCGGQPTSCSQLTAVECILAQGASIGCSYGVVSGSCSGTANACDARNETGCTFGCTPVGACIGVAVECSTATSAAMCEAQAGCTWQ